MEEQQAKLAVKMNYFADVDRHFGLDRSQFDNTRKGCLSELKAMSEKRMKQQPPATAAAPKK